MNRNIKSIVMCGVVVANMAAALTAHAFVSSQMLGTAAPPTTLGGYALTPFDQATQNAIPDNTFISSLPAPLGGVLQFSPAVEKLTSPGNPAGPGNWNTWSHGYTGAVFQVVGNGTTTPTLHLTMPSLTIAFYVYYEGYAFETSQVTLTTNSGAKVGPFTVAGFQGAQGVGFWSDDLTDGIASIDIQSDDPQFFAVAEFGMARGFANPTGTGVPIPAVSPAGLAAMTLLLALAGAALARRRTQVRNRG